MIVSMRLFVGSSFLSHEFRRSQRRFAALSILCGFAKIGHKDNDFVDEQ